MPNSSDDVGQLRFLFDVKEDPEKCDWVTIIHGKSGSWCQVAGVVAGTGRMTTFTYNDSGGGNGNRIGGQGGRKVSE